VSNAGRHGFGTAISFAPSEVLALEETQPTRPADDGLISLTSVPGMSTVEIDTSTWNAIAALIPPARFIELVEQIGESRATAAVDDLQRRNLASVIDPGHGAGSWGDDHSNDGLDDRDTGSIPTRSPDTQSHETHREAIHDPLPDGPPNRSTVFDEDGSATRSWSDDEEEYVPDQVGRQAYAAIASMRASRTDPPPQEKAHALRRLIEAVRGL
jgi:hypothetical protein